MTIAVCLNCGEMKLGAWGTCPRCLTAPETAEELASALPISDQYLGPEQLAQASQQVSAGQPVALDPEFYEQLLQGIRARGQGQPTRSKPWWKFW